MKQTIQKVKKKHEGELMKIDGVTGVGITQRKGKEVIVLYVSKNPKQMHDVVPQTLEGFPVYCEYSGEFTAF